MASSFVIINQPIHKKWFRIAFVLALITILYNFTEGLVSTWLGLADESLALFGFGIDSFIEVISGLGIAHMIWRMKLHPDSPRDEFERTALRVTGTAFYLLTAGLTVSALYNILSGHRPETTVWGVVIALISILSMWLLILGKGKTGRALNSQAILADAECTRVCLYMSLVLLAGSAVYELTGLSQADSIGTLGLAWLSLNEGKECFFKARSEAFCSCEHE